MATLYQKTQNGVEPLYPATLARKVDWPVGTILCFSGADMPLMQGVWSSWDTLTGAGGTTATLWIRTA